MATDWLIARDAVVRQAAFDHVRGMQSRDLVLSHEDIARGFMFEGQRWPLWNPQRGIFKPRGMPFLLSIRTVSPRKGGRIWYDGQRHVHRQIFAGDEELNYAFMGTDPSAPENVWLREAAERQIPFIYFLGVSPGRYQAIIPTFVVDWNPRRLSGRIAFGELAGAAATATAPDEVERRYALRLVKQRLHQASFRDSVLAAYDHIDARSAIYRTIICWTRPISWPTPTSSSASQWSPTASPSQRSTMPPSTTISSALIPTDECTSLSGC
jgi:putative restriction endonuclease